jgi:3-oxoacyl-[acyl-carrier protein] reductase
MKMEKAMDFTGKVAIVTGAGGGIGEGYANAFAARGMKVVVAELNEEGGERVAAGIRAAGGEAVFVRTDVSDEASAKACAEAASSAYGGIDYLVNNAAIFGDMLKGGYLTVDLAYLEKFMRVNAHGCLIMWRGGFGVTCG